MSEELIDKVLKEVLEVEHSYAFDKNSFRTQRKQDVKLRVDKLVSEYLENSEKNQDS